MGRAKPCCSTIASSFCFSDSSSGVSMGMRAISGFLRTFSNMALACSRLPATTSRAWNTSRRSAALSTLAAFIAALSCA